MLNWKRKWMSLRRFVTFSVFGFDGVDKSGSASNSTHTLILPLIPFATATGEY